MGDEIVAGVAAGLRSDHGQQRLLDGRASASERTRLVIQARATIGAIR